MIAFTSAIEPLRSANRVTRENLYSWSLITIDGNSVKASNGVEFNPDSTLTDSSIFDVLFVCSGVRAYDHLNKNTSPVLRALARKGMALGSICTGTIVLAEARVLDGYRCTIHWENIEGLAERYPHLNITATRFEADRNRFTCSGGLAAMDMMLHSIQLDHGQELRMKVADQLLYSSVSEPTDLQRMSIDQRLGAKHPKLLAAIGHMEAYIENPISITDMAKAIGISLRQLERLFHNNFDKSPAKYYQDLRLERARLLLRQTNLQILEIAVATGFNSSSYFTKAYRLKYGYSPSLERKKT